MADQNQGDIAMPKEYEFDINDNEVFNGTSKAMKFVSIVLFIFGVLDLLGGIMSLSFPIVGLIRIGVAICLLVGASWLWSAAVSFRMIVVTDGNDITNLMYAMKKLRSVFTMWAWILAIVIALSILVVFLFLMHTSHASVTYGG